MANDDGDHHLSSNNKPMNECSLVYVARMFVEHKRISIIESSVYSFGFASAKCWKTRIWMSQIIHMRGERSVENHENECTKHWFIIFIFVLLFVVRREMRNACAINV